MIHSFADPRLEAFWRTGKSRRIPPELHPALKRKLVMLHAAETLQALRQPPANRLDALKGDLRGQHAIRVNEQWRLVFRWDGSNVHALRLTDCHS